MSDPSGNALIAQTLADAQPKAAKKGGLLPTAAAVGVLTVVAIAGGAAVGWFVGGQTMQRAEAALKPQKAALEAEADKPAADRPDAVVKLQPMITNISTPASVVVRLQASIVVRKADVADQEILAAQVEGDTLAFLRTIDIAQIEGARGLLHLKEDLTERAKLRSPAVGDYLIESLVAQ